MLGALLIHMGAISETQKAAQNISAVYAAGKVSGNRYENEYFGLTLTPAHARFTKGGFVSSQGARARLIDAEANADKWEDKYSIAVLADTLSDSPLIRSPDDYVRYVRRQFEKEGMTTVQEESPVEISGLRFVQAIMKVKEQGRTHYQGIYSTFLKGYMISLQVEATSPERLQQVILSVVDFKRSKK